MGGGNLSEEIARALSFAEQHPVEAAIAAQTAAGLDPNLQAAVDSGESLYLQYPQLLSPPLISGDPSLNSINAQISQTPATIGQIAVASKTKAPVYVTDMRNNLVTTLSLRKDESVILEYTFYVNPQDVDINVPSRVGVYQSIGGGTFIDHMGQGVPSIQLSGHTGFQRGAHKRLIGLGYLQYILLKNFVSKYNDECAMGNAHKLKLDLQINFADAPGYGQWQVTIKELVLRRGAQQGVMLFRYQLSLICITPNLVEVTRPSGLLPKPAETDIRVSDPDPGITNPWDGSASTESGDGSEATGSGAAGTAGAAGSAGTATTTTTTGQARAQFSQKYLSYVVPGKKSTTDATGDVVSDNLPDAKYLGSSAVSEQEIRAMVGNATYDPTKITVKANLNPKSGASGMGIFEILENPKYRPSDGSGIYYSGEKIGTFGKPLSEIQLQFKGIILTSWNGSLANPVLCVTQWIDAPDFIQNPATTNLYMVGINITTVADYGSGEYVSLNSSITSVNSSINTSLPPTLSDPKFVSLAVFNISGSTSNYKMYGEFNQLIYYSFSGTYNSTITGNGVGMWLVNYTGSVNYNNSTEYEKAFFEIRNASNITNDGKPNVTYEFSLAGNAETRDNPSSAGILSLLVWENVVVDQIYLLNMPGTMDYALPLNKMSELSDGGPYTHTESSNILSSYSIKLALYNYHLPYRQYLEGRGNLHFKVVFRFLETQTDVTAWGRDNWVSNGFYAAAHFFTNINTANINNRLFAVPLSQTRSAHLSKNRNGTWYGTTATNFDGQVREFLKAQSSGTSGEGGFSVAPEVSLKGALRVIIVAGTFRNATLSYSGNGMGGTSDGITAGARWAQVPNANPAYFKVNMPRSGVWATVTFQTNGNFFGSDDDSTDKRSIYIFAQKWLSNNVPDYEFTLNLQQSNNTDIKNVDAAILTQFLIFPARSASELASNAPSSAAQLPNTLRDIIELFYPSDTSGTSTSGLQKRILSADIEEENPDYSYVLDQIISLNTNVKLSKYKDTEPLAAGTVLLLPEKMDKAWYKLRNAKFLR